MPAIKHADGQQVLPLFNVKREPQCRKDGAAVVKNAKGITYSEALAQAQAAVFPDEELKEENFNRVNTDGFEKSVVMIKHWAEMVERVMFKKQNFRIEINYNAEAKKTDFAIYTPMGAGQADIQQEHSDS